MTTTTRDEILAMQPGRELDAAIAERVMGWLYFWSGNGYLMGYPPSEQKMGVGYDERRPVPDYSTDISAAWEVVEKLDSLMVLCSARWGNGYLCAFHDDMPDWYWGDETKKIVDGPDEFERDEWERRGIAFAEGDMPAEAICKAALLAVEEGDG